MELVRNARRNQAWPRWWRSVRIGARRGNFFILMFVAAVVAFLAMTAVTSYELISQSQRGQLMPSNLTAALLVGTLVPALAIVVLVGRYLALKRSAELAGGGGMHVRLVFFFSMIAAVPTLLVVVFASFLFQSGVEFWFSDSSRGLLENANKLARGYSEQIHRDMEYESLAMAADLRDKMSTTPIVSSEFQDYYLFEVLQRKMNESTILQKGSDGNLHKLAFTRGEAPLSEISGDAIRQLDRGEDIVTSSTTNSIRAVTPID
ncbi:MAG: PAS domain-containing sensor histidine kinase, partial [Sphingomonadales bacterium]|nr:PAS domain-containing sensor histidine kinase [Sphingomonadales bacterium]